MTEPKKEIVEFQIIASALERIKVLEDAIKEHAAQRLDDRCFLDDLKLYKLVGIDEHPGLALPEEEFLGNCKRYWKCQQTGEDYHAST